MSQHPHIFNFLHHTDLLDDVAENLATAWKKIAITMHVLIFGTETSIR